MEKWGIRFGKMVPKVKPSNLMKTWKIVTGDMVQMTTGEYRGEKGKVLRVLRDRNAVIVEGINLVKRHVSAQITGQEKGSTITMEQPISAANVALLDPVKNQPTKTKWAWIEDTATGLIRKTRLSKLSNSEIPKPSPAPRIRKTGPFDTSPTAARDQSFLPSLKKAPIPDDCIL